jgi:hypothetical protein
MNISLPQEIIQTRKISFAGAKLISRLLFFNMFLVVFGYGLAVLTGGASVGPMAIFKLLVIAISYFLTIKHKGKAKLSSVYESGRTPIFFGIFVLLSVFWSNSFGRSLQNAIVLVFPMIYIYTSVFIIVRSYGMRKTLYLFHKMLIWTFCIPLVAYILTTPSLGDSNIYGYEEGQAFVSNHYGWASAILILALLGIYNRIRKNTLYTFIGIIAMLLSFYLILISASRSSMVSLALGLGIFIVSYRGAGKLLKISMVVVGILAISYLLTDPESGLNLALERTETQQGDGERRWWSTDVMLDLFEQNPQLWLTGVGFFDHTELIESGVRLKGYHNSYWEVLFGLGAPLFLVFSSFMILRPIKNYIKYFSRWILLLPPFLLIPFFESNITGGQFLFFPWFTFMFILNVKEKFWKY